MIYITGDVHSGIEGNWEQGELESELDNSIKYLRILKKYQMSCTLFVNGVLLKSEARKIKEILGYDVEIGGHTYDNFGKFGIIKSYINRKKYSCVYGSSRFQRKDIAKTRKAFESLGLEMKSWRTHAFGSNETTFKILRENGVRYVSDLLGKTKPFQKNGIIHMPINVPVDVITIAYGQTRPENRDVFASCTKGRIEPEEWFEILKKRIEDNERKKIGSILLIHPQTMAVLDNFKMFEKVAKFISKYKSGKISEFRI